MNSLISNKGRHLKLQDEIISETKRHYENLCKFRETENISFSDILRGFDVPIFSEVEKQSIEGTLTCSEMFNSLNPFQNDTFWTPSN